MADPKIELWDCFNCEEPVSIQTISGTDENSPEFYQGPPGSWITVVEYEDDEESDIVVCCSTKCCQEYFAGDDDDEPDETADSEGEELQ